MEGSRLTYRPDIDGLRALAVLSVVIGHAFPGKLPGGFTGVDIFFVISGYLITGIILKDIEAGRFSYREFYAHRFRRIIPSLSVVLMAVWVVGWFRLSPVEYLNLGKHISAGSTYLTNLLLWNEVGYFDTDSKFKPLLHLWSLGVEEQYYLLYPLLLVTALRRKMDVAKLIGILALSSFIWNVTRADKHSSEVFYLLPPRFWELLAGCGLAYFQSRQEKVPVSRYIANLSSLAAMIFFVLCLFWIDKSKAFPGFWALMPVASAVLFIFSGPEGWVNRYILSCRPVVFIGLISYPLYLWHWPILAFMRIRMRNGAAPSSSIVILGLMVMATILAWATYEWIEKPVRNKIFLSAPLQVRERKYLIAGSAAIIFTCFVGILTIRHDGFAFVAMDPKTFNAQTAGLTPSDKDCLKKFKYPIENFCKMNSPKPELLVIGDSHANHLYSGLSNFPQINVLNIGQCISLDSVTYMNMNIDRLKYFPCGDSPEIWNIQKKIIAETRSIKTVVLAGRWANYYPKEKIAEGFGSTWKYASMINSESALSQEQIFENGLSRTINYIESNGKKVVFFLDTPEMDFTVDTCFASTLMRSNTRKSCGIPLSAIMARQEDTRRIATHLLARHPGIRVFDPVPYLCKSDFCPAIEDNQLLIRDIHHLSLYGSDKLAQIFVPWLKQQGL